MKPFAARRVLVATVSLVCLVAIGAGLKADLKAGYQTEAKEALEMKEIEKTINNVIGWAVNKDFDLFFSSIGDDSNFVSVTPYQRVKFGVDAVKQDTSFWSNPAFKAIKHEVHDLNIHMSESGDVAWFYCVLDDYNEINGKPANWLNTRWTGVVQKKDGHWRVVQQHYSWAKQ